MTAWDQRIAPLVGALGVGQLLHVIDHGTVAGWTLGRCFSPHWWAA